MQWIQIFIQFRLSYGCPGSAVSDHSHGRTAGQRASQEEHRRETTRTATVSTTALTRHNWDDNEEHHFRQHLVERHRKYHSFLEINVKETRILELASQHPDHGHERR